MPQAQRSMKSDFDSDPDFDIQTSKHRDQNHIFIRKGQAALVSANDKEVKRHQITNLGAKSSVQNGVQ
mgnify:CR=1 FL=1